MSFGFHYYETTNMSLTLQYFDEKASPWVFGKQRSYAAASSIAVGLAIYILAFFFSFSQIYLLLGGLIMAAAVWALNQKPAQREVVPQRKKMILRKKYWLFYFLTFMAGARRQIFMAFAVLLMVQKFHYSVQEVTILFVVNNVINYYLSPLIGKSIIRFGERKVLSLEYFSLVFNGWWQRFSFWIIFSLISPLRSEPISRKSAIPGISHPAWLLALPSITSPLFFCRHWGVCCGF
jgi:hypothetical protein